MRVVFMGSPAFGLPTLRAVLSAGHSVPLVVTQPDRPAGRARRLTPPPVAVFARAEALTLYQPERLRGDGALEPIVAAAPDVVVVAAFGLLLPRALLELPPHGCLNLHPSLLPRWRGASPIQAAILAGDLETGVTIIQLIRRMDAGPMLAQVRVPLGVEENALELEARLADLGARLLVDCLAPWARGELPAHPQDESLATSCARLERADAQLDWSRPATELARVVRAFRGRTDAFTYWDGRLLKILAARPDLGVARELQSGEVFLSADSGGRRVPAIATGAGALALLEVALAGRPPSTGAAFLNGYEALIGARLGPGPAPTDNP